MLRITHLDDRPRASLEYRAVSHGGGVFSGRLPLWLGEVRGLSPGLAGLFCTSDLQGMAGDPPQQLSLQVVRAAQVWANQGLIPPVSEMGAVLAGDLYGDPRLEVRGAPGDVGEVWRSYGREFAWVMAVAGNHDRLPGGAELSDVPGLYHLGPALTVASGLRSAGVDGIVGRPDRPFRRDADEYRGALDQALRAKPDLLVLHGAPQRPGKRWPGCAVTAEVLDRPGDEAPLVICGHKHWDRPLHRPRGEGAPVLNVDGRVVVLVPSGPN